MKDMMAMFALFDVKVLKAERAEFLHICHAKARVQVNARSIAPTAAINLGPRVRGELGEGLVRFAAHGNIAIQLLQGRGRSRGRMRANCNLYGIAAQFVKPLLRNAQLGRRATPEKI